jgi:hypothetical protein
VCALLAGVPHEDFGEFTFAASPLVAEYALRDLQKVAADQPRPPIVALFAALQIHTDGEDRAIPIAQHLG